MPEDNEIEENVAGNAGLTEAVTNKADEFYTSMAMIEEEMRHYKSQFEGKVVLCNCDDPYESNFFKYFAMNFNYLKLRKLICTCYDGSPVVGEQLNLFGFLVDEPAEPKRVAYRIEINEVSDFNGDGAQDMADIDWLLRNDKNSLRKLRGNGDFRSPECIEILETADIVVTNPPFSLFREYVNQLMHYGKKFLIVGNVNAITYKEFFPYLRDDLVWLGCSIHSGDREFRVPDSYPLNAAGCRVDEEGKKYIRVKGVRWFTNLDYREKHEPLTLYKNYSPDEFPTLDNFEAINVDATSDIPCDYDGMMAVPITFMDKYCSDQFSIIGITQSWDGHASKIYPQQIQVDKNGKESLVTKLNDGCALKIDIPPKGKTYYKVGNEMYVKLYARILVKRKA